MRALHDASRRHEHLLSLIRETPCYKIDQVFNMAPNLVQIQASN
jgi:hypothetical protein